MQELGVEKAVLGIRGLLLNAYQMNFDSLLSLKSCVSEIKLWCLLTLFGNHMDELGSKVPDFILQDNFSLKNKDGFYYQSSSNLNFQVQFKKIRDQLVHRSFTFHDNFIYLADGVTSFNLKWLEHLVYSCVANPKNDFKKGMNDVFLVSFVPKNQKFCFGDAWKLNYLFFCKVTLLTSNKMDLAKCFLNQDLPFGHYTFDLVLRSIQQDLMKLHFQLKEGSFETLLRSIEKKYGYYIRLELIDPKSVCSSFLNHEIDSLSYTGSLQYFMNRIRLDDALVGDSIFVNAIFQILDDLQNDVYHMDHLFILKDLKDFLIKVYANILFSGIYVDRDYDYDLKNYLYGKYFIDTHFVYAKNVYKEYIRAIQKCYNEVCLYHGPSEYKTYLLGLMKHYSKLYEEVIEEQHAKRLFLNVRNAITHNQIEFVEGQVRLSITGRDLFLKHYQKKKQEWVEKVFQNHKVIWELVMDSNLFVDLLDELSNSLNFPELDFQKFKKCNQI